MITKEQLIADPNRILQSKKQFFRTIPVNPAALIAAGVTMTDYAPARLPKLLKRAVSQDEFLMELDTYSHSIMSLS